MAGTPFYTTVLGTAGHSPDQFGAEIVVDLPNKSQMANLAQAYVIGKGETLTAPVLSAPTLQSYTRGSSETAEITFSTISDTSKTFTKRAKYVAMEAGYGTLNDIPPDRFASLASEWKMLGSAQCGNDIDSATLALYSSAAHNVGSGATHFSSGLLAEAFGRLERANAPKPFYAVLPGQEWPYIATDPDMVHFDRRGQSPIPTGSGFDYYGHQVFVNNNTTAASGIAHGLVFSAAGIRLVVRDMATVREGEQMRNLVGYQCVIFLDYAYLNSFTDWIVDFQVQEVV